MGASSAVEAVACVQTLRTGVIPPTINLENQDPECDLDVVTSARKTDPKVVLNNALAFGGYDAVLALAKPGVFPEQVGEL
jgi:3-oxoacyl-[acyl-carrier-protein] synthase II